MNSLFHLALFALAFLQATAQLTQPTVNQIGQTFAAEVIGFDLEHITDEGFNWVHENLLKHKVLVFRNQSGLTVLGQRAFSLRYGPLQTHIENTAHLSGYRDVNVVSNMKNGTGAPIGLHGQHVENFHSDLSWEKIPNKVTLLKSVITPPEGGNTDYTDSTAAYADLPQEIKDQLKGVTGHYSYLKFRDRIPGTTDEEHEYLKQGADHPIISTHPETGKKNIFANPGHCASVNGKTPEESKELLDYLFNHLANPKYLYSHQWKENDAVLWDNRAVQHRATPCAYARKLVRTTVIGDDVPRENFELVQPSATKTDTILASTLLTSEL